MSSDDADGSESEPLSPAERDHRLDPATMPPTAADVLASMRGNDRDAQDDDTAARQVAALADLADAIWSSPHQYAAGDVGNLGPPDVHGWDATVLRTGIALGIAFERAYPTGAHESWPVAPEDRPEPSYDPHGTTAEEE
jgi:hypothetical protein